MSAAELAWLSAALQQQQAASLAAAQAAQAAQLAVQPHAATSLADLLQGHHVAATSTDTAALLAALTNPLLASHQAALAAHAAATATVSSPSGHGGSGKGMGRGERGDSDSIYVALQASMANVTSEDISAPGETPWEPDALRKRLAKYFRAAAKNMSYSTDDYKKVLNEFTDTALSNIAWALTGTAFLQKADFTLVVETAVRELMPDDFKAKIPPESLQDLILEAHDRALEEARFNPFLMEAVKECVEGKKAQNKVYNAGEESRKEVVKNLIDSQGDPATMFQLTELGVPARVQEFVKDFIDRFMAKLGDWPETYIPQNGALQLLDKMFCGPENCIPRSLKKFLPEPLPQNWNFISEILQQIYAKSAEKTAEYNTYNAKKRKREDTGPNFQYKTTWCKNYTNIGDCRMGDWCVFAHSEEELSVYKATFEKAIDAGACTPDGKATGKGPPNGFDGAKGPGKDYSKGFGKDDSNGFGRSDDKGLGKYDSYGFGMDNGNSYGKGKGFGDNGFGDSCGKGFDNAWSTTGKGNGKDGFVSKGGYGGDAFDSFAKGGMKGDDASWGSPADSWAGKGGKNGYY